VRLARLEHAADDEPVERPRHDKELLLLLLLGCRRLQQTTQRVSRCQSSLCLCPATDTTSRRIDFLSLLGRAARSWSSARAGRLYIAPGARHKEATARREAATRRVLREFDASRRSALIGTRSPVRPSDSAPSTCCQTLAASAASGWTRKTSAGDNASGNAERSDVITAYVV